MKKLSVVLAILMIAAILLTGCGKSDTTTSPAASSTPTATTPAATTIPADTPQEGGILKIISVGGGLVNIGNPGYIANAGDGGYSAPALEGLLRLDKDGIYQPWLATSWDIATDNIIFHIRQGVKFHDGTPLNAAAVKYNLDLSRTGEWGNLKDITSVVVMDEYTVKITFERFNWAFLDAMGMGIWGFIASPTALQNNTKEWTFTHPVGTGPFKFVSYEPDISLTFERYDDYWDGKPYLDGVEFVMQANSTTALLAFKAGEGNILGMINGTDVPGLIAAGAIIDASPGAVMCLFPDSANPNSPLSKLEVRQAISYAINTVELADAIGLGYYVPCNQPFYEGMMGYNYDVVGYPFNPTKARELLADAGYADGFTIKLLTVSGGSMDLETSLQSYLRDVGITLEFNVVSGAQFSMMVTESWDGLGSGMSPVGIGMDPAQSMTLGVVSQGTTWVSTQNMPDVDALATEGAAELDPAARDAIYQELSKKIVDDYCMQIYLYSIQFLSVHSANLHNPIGGMYVFDGYSKAWLEQ
jgi:peptide/nickel transport system substrate-binding protein